MATETQGAENGGAGLPQLDFSTFPNQIFWLLVTLVVVYFILTRVALPRIASVLSERKGTITNDLAAAEDLKAKAAEAEKAYDKALADARAEANEIVAKAKAEMQADLDAAMKEADARIAERAAESEKAIAEIRAGALESIREVATDTAQEVIAAMGAEADAAEIEKAVAAQVKG
ncbi:MAG: F0F1 ATP synthase subunit B' [Paracoccaceae bacterium]